MTARSFTKASDRLFLSTTGTALISRPDEWEKLVRKAIDQRLAIVFIDEADSVLADRCDSNVVALTNRILATLDGTGGRIPDVAYISATNHPEVLEPALLRGGRFATQVTCRYPFAKYAAAFLECGAPRSRARVRLSVAESPRTDSAQPAAPHPVSRTSSV